MLPLSGEMLSGHGNAELGAHIREARAGDMAQQERALEYHVNSQAWQRVPKTSALGVGWGDGRRKDC